ncbi:MAG: glycoside hydrolase family 16 protein [Bacteroidetes bacterium]|nr:glycoside hydrolase family 16 protein [Bacteroidota bacterium]
MKLKCLNTILLVAFSFSIANAQLLLQIKKDSIISYNYSGGDEFNQQELRSDWNSAPWPRVIMPQEVGFVSKNVVLENGQVKFLALKEDSTYIMADIEIDSAFLKRKKIALDKNQFLTKYSAGVIFSRKKYHYGLYELRFKVEEGKGIWPAFWFYGGYKNEEIDAFELKGEKNNQLHVDTHCPDGCDRNYDGHKLINKNWGGWMPLSDYLHKGYNIMLLEWKPEEVIWYINGYPLAYFKGSLPNPMSIYINTSVAKDNEAFNPGPDETTPFPNSYFVDYLRIWHTNTTFTENGHLVLSPNDDLTLSNAFEPRYDIHPKKKSGLNYNRKKLRKSLGMLTLTLSSKRLLTINKIGVEKKSGINVSITGVQSKQVYQVCVNNKEETVIVNPLDKTLEVKITTPSRVFLKLVDIK